MSHTSEESFYDALPFMPALPGSAKPAPPEENASPPSPTETSSSHTLPTSARTPPPWGWDYVFVFKLPRSVRHKLQPNDGHPSEDDRSRIRVQQRLEILSRLRLAGFVFSQLLVPSDGVILVRFSLPEDVLMRKAHAIGIELRLTDEFGGGFLAFDQHKMRLFTNFQHALSRRSYFAPADRVLIILNVLQSREDWGCDLNIEQLLYDQTLLQAFALHSKHEHEALIHNAVWASWWNPLWKPPLKDLKDYLGARVSFYFVFVSYYARRLLLIAVLSIPVYVTYRVLRNLKVITILRWVFSIGLVLWTTFFLEYWKRRNASMNIEWGLNDFHEDTADDTRVQYVGETRYGFYCQGGFVPLEDLAKESEERVEEGHVRVSGQDELLRLPQNPWQDPRYARNARLVSLAVTSFFVALVGSLTFLLLWFRDNIIDLFQNRIGLSGSIPGVLNAILITVFDSVWRPVSLWLTRRENHRTNQLFENSLIYKRFAFQFVSNYVSLFYIAFVRPYLSKSCPVGPLSDKPDCMLELERQLTSQVITKATIGQILEIVVPWVTSRLKQWQARRKSSSEGTAAGGRKENEEQEDEKEKGGNEESRDEKVKFNVCGADNRYVEESKLGKYTSTMEDYAELVIQFGYLVLFGLAFPLASVVNLVNNVIEVRTDAYKILQLSQRVDADDAADIGAWYPILEFVNIVAVGTNVGLLVFTMDSLNVLGDLDGRLGDDAGTKMLYRVVCFFVVEHALLGLKGLAAGVIKDVASRTHRAVARQSYDVARWFGVGWQDAFRGKTRLQVDADLARKCDGLAEDFDTVSRDGERRAEAEGEGIASRLRYT